MPPLYFCRVKQIAFIILYKAVVFIIIKKSTLLTVGVPNNLKIISFKFLLGGSFDFVKKYYRQLEVYMWTLFIITTTRYLPKLFSSSSKFNKGYYSILERVYYGAYKKYFKILLCIHLKQGVLKKGFRI